MLTKQDISSINHLFRNQIDPLQDKLERVYFRQIELHNKVDTLDRKFNNLELKVDQLNIKVDKNDKRINKKLDKTQKSILDLFDFLDEDVQKK